MKLNRKIILWLCVFFAVLFVLLKMMAISENEVMSRVKVAHTGSILFYYAVACSNYFSIYGESPKSLNDLYYNKSNIVFIDTISTNQDAWHHLIEFRPYDPKLGYGIVRSLGRDGKLGGVGPDADVEKHFYPATNVDSSGKPR